MKISLKCLSQYVEIDLAQPEALASKLTHLGLEVESLEKQATRFEHVVVGRLIDVQPHPQADKLTLCQVDVGSARPQQIVCGATNHKAGDLVAVALPGAVLPQGMKIKKTSIRGLESNGMLCSAQELDLGEDKEGILILNANKKTTASSVQVGQAFSAYMGLDDVVLDLSITPNRGDCLSHLGVARELKASGFPPAKEKKNSSTKVSDTNQLGTNQLGADQSSLQVQVLSLECRHYLGQHIKGVRIGPSPVWLQNFLKSCGLKTHNNVVDITNYILLDLGQPLHAFDAAKIKGPIRVQTASKGQKIQLLDETELSLQGDELLIQDSQAPLALAGVMGGLHSSINDSTTDLFIESACFDATSVQRTSRRYNLITDSSYRFARGVDPEITKQALLKTCDLILKLAGGQLAGEQRHASMGPAQHSKSSPAARPSILIDEQQIQDRLGLVEVQDVDTRLQALGFTVSPAKTTSRKQDPVVLKNRVWSCTPPSWRSDIHRDIDLVEEYARHLGYDQISSTLPPLNTPPQASDSSYVQKQNFIQAFLYAGFQQALNPSFVGQQWLDRLGMGLNSTGPNNKADDQLVNDRLVFLQNPINDECNVMRPQLLGGLIKNLHQNSRHTRQVGSLFELGPVFEKKQNTYHQHPRLAAVLWGQKANPWQHKAPAVYELKAGVEKAFEFLKLAYQWKNSSTLKPKNLKTGVLQNVAPSHLHIGQSAQLIVQGKAVGWLGTLHPGLKQKLKLRTDVAVFEMQVLPGFVQRSQKITATSRFPRIERDMALVVPQTIAASDVLRALKSAGTREIKNLYVFDVYKGEQVPKNYVSLAVRFVYQSEVQTFTDEQIASLQAQALAAVQKRWPEVKLRA